MNSQLVQVNVSTGTSRVVGIVNYDGLSLNPVGTILLGRRSSWVGGGSSYQPILADPVAPSDAKWPDYVGGLLWAPDHNGFLYRPGRTDVRLLPLLYYNWSKGNSQTIYSPPATSRDFGMNGVTAACFGPGRSQVTMAVSHRGHATKNSIEDWQPNTNRLTRLAATPGRSVVGLHWAGPEQLVYGTGPAFPGGNYFGVPRFRFWLLDTRTGQKKCLFTRPTTQIVWLPGNRGFVFLGADRLFYQSLSSNAQPIPLPGTAGATWFSVGPTGNNLADAHPFIPPMYSDHALKFPDGRILRVGQPPVTWHHFQVQLLDANVYPAEQVKDAVGNGTGPMVGSPGGSNEIVSQKSIKLGSESAFLVILRPLSVLGTVESKAPFYCRLIRFRPDPFHPGLQTAYMLQVRFTDKSKEREAEQQAITLARGWHIPQVGESTNQLEKSLWWFSSASS